VFALFVMKAILNPTLCRL